MKLEYLTSYIISSSLFHLFYHACEESPLRYSSICLLNTCDQVSSAAGGGKPFTLLINFKFRAATLSRALNPARNPLLLGQHSLPLLR